MITKISMINITPISFQGHKPHKQYLTPLGQDEFVRSNNSTLDADGLINLDISHFRFIDDNSVRGVTLANCKPEVLKEMKKFGINTVVDLRMPSKDMARYSAKCENSGIEYFHFPLKLNLPIFNMPFTTSCSNTEFLNDKKEFLQKLSKFFDISKKGNYYMACELGLHRTDLAVTMNYLLNPQVPSKVPLLTQNYDSSVKDFTNKYIAAIRNLFHNLSKKDLQTLGLPEDYRFIIAERITELKKVNLKKL